MRQSVSLNTPKRVAALVKANHPIRQELFQNALQRFEKALSSFPAIILGRKRVENSLGVFFEYTRFLSETQQAAMDIWITCLEYGAVPFHFVKVQVHAEL